MENYWTSNKTINGLRHFVLVNETKENGNMSFLMVSVLDSEINFKSLNKGEGIDEIFINEDSLFNIS